MKVAMKLGWFCASLSTFLCQGCYDPRYTVENLGELTPDEVNTKLPTVAPTHVPTVAPTHVPTVAPTLVPVVLANLAWTDLDLRENYVSGEFSFSLSNPKIVSSATIRFANDEFSVVGTTPAATTTSMTEVMSITVAPQEVPVGASRFLVEIATTGTPSPAMPGAVIADRTPLSIGGMQFWVRSDRGVLAPDGNPAVDAGKVATWQDQSGNNRHLVQSIDERRPTFCATGVYPQGGLPALCFLGGWWGNGQNMEWNYSYSLPATWIIAAKFSGADSGQHSILGSQNDLEHFFDLKNGWMGPNVTGQPENGPVAWAAYALRWGAGVFTGSYGVSAYTRDYIVPGAPYSMFYLGSRGKASWNGGRPVQYFNGAIAEAMMFDGVVSDQDLLSLSNYIKTRYSISP